MGAVHKFKPEVRDFIIEEKRLKPSLSCRAVTLLIAEKFMVKVSKSSINAIFQKAGLSMPIGRRIKHKKQKVETLGNRVKLALQGPVVEQPRDLLVQESAQQIEEAQRKIQAEEVQRKDEAAAQKEAQRKAEDARRQQEEKAAQEAGLKEEQEKWARRAEEEKNIISEIARKAQSAPQQSVEEKLLQQTQKRNLFVQESAQQIEEAQRKVQAEEAQRKDEAAAQKEAQRKAEDARRQQEEKAAPEATFGTMKEPLFSEDDEFAPINMLPQSRLSSGAILLKAVDRLIGGSSQINAILCKMINRDPEQMLALTEALIFESLFEKNNNFSDLWSLVGSQYTREILQNYSQHVQRFGMIKLDILQVISNIFTEIRGVKISFSAGDIVYLDGQLHTTWSTASLPSDFSSTIYDLKNYLNRYFFEAAPLVLFTAPEYDIPPKEFFTLLSNLNNISNPPDVLTLYGNKLEDLENISLQQQRNYSVVFCLWPWQFISQRKVNKLGDFALYHIESVNKDLYLAEIEIDLLQPSLGRSITLKGCAVKANLNEKIRMAILSNSMPVESLDKLAELYLNHWPNPEESLYDFNRKIELSTYTGNTEKFVSLSDSATGKDPVEELKEIFVNYIKMLDTYLRWYFLPLGYQQKDFAFTSENFYKLPAEFVADKTKVSVKIQVGADYPYLEDLEYLIRRFNERQIDLHTGQLFCLENISRT